MHSCLFHIHPFPALFCFLVSYYICLIRHIFTHLIHSFIQLCLPLPSLFYDILLLTSMRCLLYWLFYPQIHKPHLVLLTALPPQVELNLFFWASHELIPVANNLYIYWCSFPGRISLDEPTLLWKPFKKHLSSLFRLDFFFLLFPWGHIFMNYI